MNSRFSDFMHASEKWKALEGGLNKADSLQLTDQLREIARLIPGDMSLSKALETVLSYDERKQLDWLILQTKSPQKGLGMTMRMLWSRVRREQFPNIHPDLAENDNLAQAKQCIKNCSRNQIISVIDYCNELLLSNLAG